MHFADTHFGVELYGRLDPETGLNTQQLSEKSGQLPVRFSPEVAAKRANAGLSHNAEEIVTSAASKRPGSIGPAESAALRSRIIVDSFSMRRSNLAMARFSGSIF